MKISCYLPFLFLSHLGFAQDPTGLPSKKSVDGDEIQNFHHREQLPGDNVFPNLTDQARKDLEESRRLMMGKTPPPQEGPTESPVPQAPQPPLPTAARSQPRSRAVPPPMVTPPTPQPPPVYDLANGVRVFARNAEYTKLKDTLTLPSGSIALATVLYGVQVTPNVTDRSVPVELDYAWLGPNGAVVEMKNCRAWVPVKADMNIERLIGVAHTIVCRTPRGAVFEVPIKAHLVNQEDEYLGASATLVLPGKAKAAALSFLQGGVEAFGKAMAAAQISKSATTGAVGPAVSAENVTGNETKYIVGNVLEHSTSKFLDWFIDYYSNLSPQLAVGPGHKVYLAIEGSVQIPKIFFGESMEASTLSKAISATKQSPKHNVNTDKMLGTK